MPDTIRYAGYPFTIVREAADSKSKPVKQLIWGDWIKITGEASGGYLPVRVRGVDGFVAETEVQTERLLEIVFVDIGQGDGCLLITPDEKIVVIDAGEGDNMARFLRWRFRDFKKKIRFEAAILSHSDLDHYGGFSDLFEQENLTFRNVYTNGLMERVAKSTEILGKPATHAGRRYIVDLIRTKEELQTFLADPEQVGSKKYPNMLKKALEGGKFENFRSLSVKDSYVPGFEPAGDRLSMELLGPVVEDAGGKPGLRWFGDVGKTKNGHSIALRLRYRDITIFAGGDLNIPSESLLLGHHSGDPVPDSESGRLAAAEKARAKLSADFAKACHHGSADVSPAFLSAIHPLATVISSGDEEAFSHPRADTLGIIGKHSRGLRPSIFSTELARSAPERIKNGKALRDELDRVVATLQTPMTAAERKKVDASIENLKKNLERSISTYGAINLRTDGRKAIMAQKIEAPANSKSQWDIYRFEKNAASGELEFVSKHLGENDV